MVRKNIIWTRSRIRTLFQDKGFKNFKTYRHIGITKGFDEDNNCVIRISNIFLNFNSTYEIEIPIYEIKNIKISKDIPYINVLIFTKKNEMIEFHIPYYKLENE